MLRHVTNFHVQSGQFPSMDFLLATGCEECKSRFGGLPTFLQARREGPPPPVKWTTSELRKRLESFPRTLRDVPNDSSRLFAPFFRIFFAKPLNQALSMASLT